MRYEGREWLGIDTPLTFKEVAASPVRVRSSHIALYAKDKAGTAALYLKDPNGVEREIAPLEGSGGVDRIAIWSSGGGLTSNESAKITNLTGATALILKGTPNSFIKIDGDATGNPHLEWAQNGVAKASIQYLDADDTLRIANGGSAHLALTSAGFVGIGTNSPGAKLDVRALVNATGIRELTTAALAVGERLILLSGGVNGISGSADFRIVKEGTSDQTGLQWHSWDGSAYVERLRLGSAGQLGIAGANYGTSGQVLTSKGASLPPAWEAAAGGVSDHGALTGLLDDDHSIYALLAGRAGGQTLRGGIGVADALNLVATAGLGDNDASIIGKVGNNGATQFFRASINSGFFIGNGTSPGAGLSVATTGSDFSGGDWIAWFRRENTVANNELLFRLEHFSGTQPPLPIITGIANRGSFASKVALSADDHLLILDGRGYDGSIINHGEYALGVSDTSAQVALKAAEAWSGTAHGSYISLRTTAIGSIAPVERLRVGPSGNIGHLGFADNPFAAWVGASDADYSVIYDSYNSIGAGTSAGLIARRARGSQASQSAVLNGDILFTFQARGHNGADFPVAGGAINFVATENWSSPSNGAGLLFLYTRNGTNFMTSALQLTTPADGEIAILVERNVGGTFSIQRVSMGAVDSAGSGFRLLRVPN